MQQLTIHSPYDGKPLGMISLETEDDAQKKLDRANSLFKDRTRRLQPYARSAVLRKFAMLIEAEKDGFAMHIATEGGKPLADARVEVTRAIDGILLAVSEFERVGFGREVPMGLTKATEHYRAVTVMEPVGVVFAISAFNHPLNLLVHQVVPAVMAGCPVILKPALSVPLIAVRFVELLEEAGLPEGWCQLLLCQTEVTARIAASPQIHFLSFIGSSKVGWTLRSQLAPGVRYSLEHGGAAPVIVDDTIDVEAVIPSIVKGGYYHSGQVCVSVQRIFVHEAIEKAFTEALVQKVKLLITGDPAKETTDCGPLIRKKEAARVHEWVMEAKETGGEILTGGSQIGDSLYAPTVVFNPAADAKLSREEVFGPVVAVYPYASLEEAIERANALPGRMQSAIYTRDVDTANKAALVLDATGVMINEATTFRADWMPFGGRGAAGVGMGGIGYSMQEYLQEKIIVTKLM